MKLSEKWQILLIIEFAVFVISLFMPITPSKTGLKFKLATLFIDDPSYFEEVAVHYVLINILLIFISSGIFMWFKWKKSKKTNK